MGSKGLPQEKENKTMGISQRDPKYGCFFKDEEEEKKEIRVSWWTFG